MNCVLVVDDDAHIRRLVRVVLAAAGFDVVEAENGREALALIETRRPAVLVLDVNMPVMDGRELFSVLNERNERPSTLMISADSVEKVRREVGAEACLAKPFEPDELVSKVSKLCRAAA